MDIRNFIDYNWKILTNEKDKNLKEILFNPEKDRTLYICNIPIHNGKMICEKDKSEIFDNQIVEMRYEPNNQDNINWTPLRVRYDKIKPQFFIIANKIWDTILNPVTEDLITGVDDIYTLKTTDIT